MSMIFALLMYLGMMQTPMPPVAGPPNPPHVYELDPNPKPQNTVCKTPYTPWWCVGNTQ